MAFELTLGDAPPHATFFDLDIFASRFRATSAVFLLTSVAIHRRPNPLHAAGICPRPQNGSTTSCPGSVSRWVKYSTSDSACPQS